MDGSHPAGWLIDQLVCLFCSNISVVQSFVGQAVNHYVCCVIILNNNNNGLDNNETV